MIPLHVVPPHHAMLHSHQGVCPFRLCRTKSACKPKLRQVSAAVVEETPQSARSTSREPAHCILPQLEHQPPSACPLLHSTPRAAQARGQCTLPIALHCMFAQSQQHHRRGHTQPRPLQRQQLRHSLRQKPRHHLRACQRHGRRRRPSAQRPQACLQGQHLRLSGAGHDECAVNVALPTCPSQLPMNLSTVAKSPIAPPPVSGRRLATTQCCPRQQEAAECVPSHGQGHGAPQAENVESHSHSLPH
mmetsp:Transcript_117319/g.233844  ORF Transcript_117319/g.233844 Transcript_117319/m.233844 type:complete len:246 (-) Transcript_117319:273-1010(-)